VASLADDPRVEQARAVHIENILAARGIRLRKSGAELIGPCPVCGGTDRFSINIRKQIFNCRGCGKGGDGISLVQFLDGTDFLQAVETLAGKKPNGGGRQSAKRIVYEFCDPQNGEVRYRKIRLDRTDGSKELFFDKGGRNDSEPLLYAGERLADVGEGRPVWIVEGENKVDRMRELGAIAVCGDTGAKSKWLPAHVELLKGLRIILWPDSDEPGEKYIANAAAAILAEDPSTDIRIVRPFGLPNGAKGLDVCDWEGDAETLARLAEGAEPYAPLREQTTTENPIRLLSYAEMTALAPTDWAIDGVLPRHSKSVLWGQSDSFKSFLAADMGCSVSTGRSYHGRAVKRCKVIYVANEGANAVGRKRIPAWMAYHEIPVADRQNIFLVKAETILPNDVSRSNLLVAIRTIIPPGEDFLLIIDVLRGTMTGSESDDEAANAWTRAAEILINEGASILTVTHSPYCDDGRIRGSSHLWGSFDTRLHVEGDKDERTAVLKVNRHKDHDSGGEWSFQLEIQDIAEHPGESSLVPRLDGSAKVKASKTKHRKLPASAINAIDALRYALDEVGAIPPASNHIPPNVKCVTVKQWRSYFDQRTTLDKLDSREKAFSRGSEKLQSEKMVSIWGVYAWRA
jgi:AAA domain/CHC2 zinc finger